MFPLLCLDDDEILLFSASTRILIHKQGVDVSRVVVSGDLRYTAPLFTGTHDECRLFMIELHQSMMHQRGDSVARLTQRVRDWSSEAKTS